MKQYLDLLQTIKEKGTYKPAAREGMPGTQSLFGYQFRHNLADGFPLLTTKKMFWKGVVIELLWFLRGDTNIKFLVDNGVNIWNEDAYNYYLKKKKQHEGEEPHLNPPYTFENFINAVKILGNKGTWPNYMSGGYEVGDTGFQYGRVWRNWEKTFKSSEGTVGVAFIDQIKNLIEGLKKSPESRRHIVTAIDPSHDNDLALYWCHAMFQFNCRPLTLLQRSYVWDKDWVWIDTDNYNHKYFDSLNIPKYYLDCQLYQRSADAVLGVPFNIASYALLTELIARMCNMIPGEFIHTFGDVHIYDNHKDAVEEQLKRTPSELPKLNMLNLISIDDGTNCYSDLDLLLSKVSHLDFQLENYNPLPSIKAELSTGLKK